MTDELSENLHPQAKDILAAIERAQAKGYWTPIEDCTPDQARAQAAAARTGGVLDPPSVAVVSDHLAPGSAGDIPVRYYRPEASDLEAALPVLIYYQGGGWVLGDLDSHDTACRMLANAGGFAVIAVDYRKGPEARFPAAVDDAYAALEWVAGGAGGLNIDPTRIAVGGDSAGGNLSAVVSLMAQGAGSPAIAFQALIYPATDFYMNTRSHTEFGDGYLLTRAGQAWFHSHYLNGPSDMDDWRASPARAANHANLPPALVLTAECDPLRDEGKAYAETLQVAGVSVTYSCYPGQIHNFFNLSRVIDDATRAVEEVAGQVATAFAD